MWSDDCQPIGFVAIGGDFRQELAVGDARGSSEFRLFLDLPLDLSRELYGFVQVANCSSHVQIGLIQAKRLDK